MKIGIFGGSFNPPHKMHERIVLELLNKGYLDKVICVPTGNYYKKAELIDMDYRQEMLKIMFDGNKDVIVSDISRNKEYEYTYQVLDYFKSVFKNDQIYFICGGDNLKQFTSWKNYDYILKNYRILVINRGNDNEDKLKTIFSKYEDSITFCSIGKNSVSSSMIRKNLELGEHEKIKEFLDRKVLNYILEREIYKSGVMKDLVEALIEKNKTVSAMESCTGGGFANAITNIEGASTVLKFSAVTYSNEFKIKMGVDSQVIDKYTVYSMETAEEMAKNISIFAGSDYGIGITGKLKRFDKDNLFGTDDVVFVSIYDAKGDVYYNHEMKVDKDTRQENKDLVIFSIAKWILEVL